MSQPRFVAEYDRPVHSTFKRDVDSIERQDDLLSDAQSDLSNEKGEAMRKTLMALAAVATVAVSAVAAPAPAQAQRYLGAAIAGGLIGGAIVGSAVAAPYYYGYGYGPGYYRPYGYYGGPAYVAAPGYYGGCGWQRQRFWDGYGWRFRNVRVCG
jgi:hypothetical protein